MQIINLRLQEFAESAQRISGLELHFTSGIRKFIFEKGFDPVYGARPLKRAIVKHIETPLADYLLRNPLKTGSKITVRHTERSGISFDIGN